MNPNDNMSHAGRPTAGTKRLPQVSFQNPPAFHSQSERRIPLANITHLHIRPSPAPTITNSTLQQQSTPSHQTAFTHQHTPSTISPYRLNPQYSHLFQTMPRQSRDHAIRRSEATVDGFTNPSRG